MKYLTRKELIIEVKKIEDSFLSELRINLFELAPNAVCRISEGNIELGISGKDNKMAFASSIELYGVDRFFNRGNAMNFGSSGNFTPEVKESYWRTIHAASLLKNWDKACEIINNHCKMYSDLQKECF
jgi:hypothetical protein